MLKPNLTSVGFVVPATLGMALLGMCLNFLVIQYGPETMALSALIYGPFSKGAGANGFMLMGIAVLFALSHRWIKGVVFLILGAALLYFSYGISLEMALVSRPTLIPNMIATDMGCYPNHLIGVLQELEIPLADSTKLCEEG
ncbi:hypothetical protein [Marinobacter salicampi]|uniref:hypothetical protein n=1 Tax=Marinobacter salicampi TaxID=435907 RepID=UPI001408890A|nr:hypothetical protein [Marinobacter salicampi]